MEHTPGPPSRQPTQCADRQNMPDRLQGLLCTGPPASARPPKSYDAWSVGPWKKKQRRVPAEMGRKQKAIGGVQSLAARRCQGACAAATSPARISPASAASPAPPARGRRSTRKDHRPSGWGNGQASSPQHGEPWSAPACSAPGLQAFPSHPPKSRILDPATPARMTAMDAHPHRLPTHSHGTQTRGPRGFSCRGYRLLVMNLRSDPRGVCDLRTQQALRRDKLRNIGLS